MRRRIHIDSGVFDDEEACIRVFFRWRWPRGFICPRCGHRHASRVGGRRAWRCRSCNRQIHLTSGTLLHGSHLPLRHWLYAIVIVGGRKQSISAMQLSKDTGMAYCSAWSLLHRIRRSLHDDDARKLTRGVIEVTSRPLTASDARLRHAPHSWTEPPLLVIAIERLTHDTTKPRALRFGRLRASAIPVGADVADFTRAVVNGPHDATPKPIGAIVAANIVDWIRGTFHGVSIKYLQAYLDEAVFRFDRRRREDLLPSFVGRRLMTSARLPSAALKTPPELVAAHAAATSSAALVTEPTNDGIPAEIRQRLTAEALTTLRHLLTMPFTGLTPVTITDDEELFFAVKELRRMLPIRLIARAS